MFTIPPGKGKYSFCTVTKLSLSKSLVTSCYSRGAKRPASKGQAKAFSIRVGKTRGPPISLGSYQGQIQTTFQGQSGNTSPPTSEAGVWFPVRPQVG